MSRIRRLLDGAGLGIFGGRLAFDTWRSMWKGEPVWIPAPVSMRGPVDKGAGRLVPQPGPRRTPVESEAS